VVQEVVGSKPIFHPTENLAAMRGFFMPENQWLCSSAPILTMRFGCKEPLMSLVRLEAKLEILRLTLRLTFTIPLVYLPQHPLLFHRCGFHNAPLFG
jgi:hypothetical protein